MPKKIFLPPAVLLLLRVVVAVFLAEALVMFLLPWLLPPLGGWLVALIDSTFLTLLIIPLLWRWLVVGDRQRQRTEENQRLLSAAVTTADNAILITNHDGTIVWVNPAFVTMTGYTLADAVGKNPRDLVKSGQQERAVYDKMWATILAGRVWHGQFVNCRKDGSFYPEEQTITPVRDTAGKITHFIAIKQDITAGEQAKKALWQSEERYRLLFKSIPIPMWAYDLETLRFLAVNQAAVQQYGYTNEEFLGLTIERIYLAEDIPVLRKFIAELTPESIVPSEWQHRRKNGTVFHVETICRPLQFGSCAARLVLATDVTEKKLLHEKLLHAQRLESIGMLAAGIAHDLNNVLAPIVFAAPMLRDSLSSPRDLKILDTLERSAGRGAELVKQILGFAHTATGEFRPTQVKHLVRDIISVIESTFPKSIQLQRKISSDLWLVQGNATQIHQVLLNLCVNARDAMPQGGTLRIAAANRCLNAAEADAIPGALSGAYLMLEIADTGTGIPPEILQDIWQPFFTTKGVGKGTGLGLSTIRGIVTSHHGFVELQTEVGRGSTFRVFLPAVESESPRPRSSSPLDTPEGQGELILVVEDDTLIRDIVTDILRKHGYRVVSCVDGVEAITLFNAQPSAISLVVTDVDMPRLDGVALARALLQFRPGLRLIAISGLPSSETDASDLAAMKKLVHAFLLKPFKAEDLLGAVYYLLHPSEKP